MGGMHVQIAETPEADKLATVAQLQQHSKRCCVDFTFTQIVESQDSPKLMFEMMMDAFRPFLGQYYQACSPLRDWVFNACQLHTPPQLKLGL